MQLAGHSLFLQKPSVPSHRRRSLFGTRFKRTTIISLANSHESRSSQLAVALQAETLEILEWPSVCNDLCPFTSTSMALSLTRNAAIPIGQTKEESQKLLDQTTAALHAMDAMKSDPLDLSAVEDVSDMVQFAASGQLLTISELCRMRRALRAARAVLEKLEALATNSDGDSSERSSYLLAKTWEEP